MFEGFAVGTRRWQIPAAMSATLTYHLLILCGSIMTVGVPGFMHDRIRIRAAAQPSPS